MTTTEYESLVKNLAFKDYGPGFYRQGTVMDSAFLGLDCHIQYGMFVTAGKIGSQLYVPHIHDFDQIMCFLGSDQNDLSDLWGEVEICLGNEMEKHMITTTTAVAIPKGMPHMPATINKMEKRMLLMVISLAPKYSCTPLPTDKKPIGPLGFREAK